jgi:small-conductance mechanosensitive channel
MRIIMVLAAGVALSFLLSGLLKLSHLVTMSDGLRRRVQTFLPGTMLLVSLAYYFWALTELFGSQSFYPVVVAGSLAIFLLLLVWFVLRDLVAGVVFATKHPALQGRRIEAENVSGQVLKVGLTGLRVRTDGGQILSVPYTRIAGRVLAEQFREQSADQFRCAVPVTRGDDTEVLRERLTREILLSPWVNPHLPLSVRIATKGTDRSAEVLFHSLNEHHAALVEERLRKQSLPPPRKG